VFPNANVRLLHFIWFLLKFLFHKAVLANSAAEGSTIPFIACVEIICFCRQPAELGSVVGCCSIAVLKYCTMIRIGKGHDFRIQELL
jgi:hypothetical protein